MLDGFKIKYWIVTLCFVKTISHVNLAGPSLAGLTDLNFLNLI